MSDIKEVLKEVLFARGKEFHGKKRLLFHLIVVVLAVTGSLGLILARKHLPFEIFQVFMLCVIVLLVWRLTQFRLQELQTR
jgi:uncharacterized membrane protein YfcA